MKNEPLNSIQTANRLLLNQNEKLRKENDELKVKVKNLISDVKKYGGHTDKCVYHYGHDCDCGLDKYKKY